MKKEFVLFLLALAFEFSTVASAFDSQFVFGRNANNLTGQSGAISLVNNGTSLTFESDIAGSDFNESGKGLGIDSRSASPPNPVETSLFGDEEKFNLLEFVGPLDQFPATDVFYGESITFSFDRPGVINELYFDGVKDESFEFFRLETPGGEIHTFFDAEIGLRITDTAFVTEPNVTLLTDAIVQNDDDLAGLAIPYKANDEFRLIYGEFIVPAALIRANNSQTAGNGARWEGIAVTNVPEPASLLMLAAGLALLFRRAKSPSRC